MTGCATGQDLRKLEIQLAGQIKETQQQIEQPRTHHSLDMQSAKQALQGVRDDFRQLPVQQLTQLADVQTQVQSGLAQQVEAADGSLLSPVTDDLFGKA